ncbi:MAG: alpha/beta fold hydrolase [Acidimicrobiales bacterium]
MATISRRRIGPLMVSAAGTPDGYPLLFLHGIGSAGVAFDPQLAHFGDSRWCLSPDAPGYAQSDDDPAIASLSDFVDHYIALLDTLEVERADLLGLSWGGVIVTKLAADHPDRVARLILVDTSRGSGINPEKAAGMLARGAAFEAEGAETFAKGRTPRLLAADASAELADRVASTMAAAIRLPGYRQAVASMAETDNTDALRSIAAPTLVIVGTEDQVCPPAESETIAELVPNAALRFIERAGHLTNQEQPERFNQVLDEFLAG